MIRRTLGARIAVALVASSCLLGLGRGYAHPGGTDDEGCHTCRTNCEKWDEKAGERHCHGESDSESSSAGDEDSGDETEQEETRENGPYLSEDQRAYVEKVLDGDTLLVRVLSDASQKVRIRILGIDCPESHKNPKCRREGKQGGASCAEQIPQGLLAAKRAAELVKHEVVTLESEEGDGDFERGRYDRVLAYIRLGDGRDLGRTLVGEGLCEDYGDEYPHPRHEAYERAEQAS